MLLPRAALERWRTLAAQVDADADPVGRLAAWLDRLAARMLCTGGRLARLLIETGLCEVDDILACARAQLEAGAIGADALRRDLDGDLDVLAELAPLDALHELSARTAELGRPDDADALHAALASRLLAAGRAQEAEAALARVAWHGTLLTWLEDHLDALPPELRGPLFARAARLVAATRLPAEYHVELFARLAALTQERRWLERAREVLAALPAEALAATPDHEHPLASIAWAEARLGDLDAALAHSSDLPADERWTALLRLLPLAPDPERRAAIVELLLAAMTPEHTWAWLLEAAPELSARALRAIEAITDEDARREELCAAARFMRGEPARRACAWLLAHAAAQEPASPAWVHAWEDLSDALTSTGHAALLDPDARRSLVDTLLARPELDLWAEVGPFVPDDRATAVLERSYDGLTRADHYRTRQAWLDLGLPLLDRVPREQAERWLELAAAAAVGTAIDGASLERLAAWSPAQQRQIVLGRLASHQREFLPRQLVDPWLFALGGSLPSRLCPDWSAWIDRDVLARRRDAAEDLAFEPADDPAEQLRLRDALAAIAAADAWPGYDELRWTFALLGRCAGEAGVRAGLAALTELRARLSRPSG